MAVAAYINRIGTAVPPHDVHGAFVAHAPRMLPDERLRRLFRRMAERAGIDHRYSVLAPTELDGGLFEPGGFPDTRTRMALYQDHAPALAERAVAALDLAADERPSHLIVTTCTGLHAPGLDLELQRRLGLDGGIERTVVGFMGCYAAISGLKLAHHIVRSEPAARVLLANVELCTLHLQDTDNLEKLLSFLIFADGCAASLISAVPTGLEILGFDTAVLPASGGEITWRIGNRGFDMHLAGTVPATIGRGLPAAMNAVRNRFRLNDPSLWAVHPGGRSVLDAVGEALDLPEAALAASRETLRRYGNMSSPTVMFVLQSLMAQAGRGETGAALAFGPGLTAETMLFRVAGHA